MSINLKDNIKANISKNSATATTLATARTINGTSFNGSANITTANWGTARTLTIGSTGKSVNGSGNVSWSLSEIGAAAASHGRHVPDVCTTITDWNAATTNGWYMGNNAANAPTSGSNVWYFGEVVAHNTNYLMQTVYQFTASADAKAIPKYIRARTNGTWGAWTNVTVSIAVPSNAKFTDTNTWRGVQDNLTSTATDQSLSANQGKVLKGLVDGKANSSHTHNYAGSSSAGGNANAAVKLATARTINGTSFDGTANITTSNWGTARTVKIGNTGKSVNGSANVTWTWNEMQVPRAYSGSYNFGGDQTAITTAQFLTMLADLGAFSQPYWISRGSWSYASNRYINDTGCGNIHLAGCTVEVLGSSTSNCTIRVITPTTSSSGVSNGEFIYINNGSDYSPGWRRQYNTKYKPSASEIGALPISGGTMTGDLTLKNYLKINAWSGYGSGTADLWYNGNAGNIHCSSGIKTDKALHSAWHNTFEDGFNIPTRDGGNRRGVIFNTYGSGDNSYLEIARRNSANTDWDWNNSIKFYPHEVKVPSLQCYGGGGCFKLYPGNAGHTYMGFFLNGTTRGAWMGYGSNGSTQFTISADGGTGRVDIHNLNVHGIPLSIQSSAPGCGGVWIQI